MPTSNLALAPAIIHLCWEVQPARILDVGPGWGKYGLLLREYVNPKATIDAVEMEPSYITPRLEAIYDTVYKCDVRDFGEGTLETWYDLVLMVDVIEHLTKEDGLALLERIPGHVVVCTPSEFFQNPDTVPSEVHRSLWTPEDFGDRLEVQWVNAQGAVLVRLKPQ